MVGELNDHVLAGLPEYRRGIDRRRDRLVLQMLLATINTTTPERDREEMGESVSELVLRVTDPDQRKAASHDARKFLLASWGRPGALVVCAFIAAILSLVAGSLFDEAGEGANAVAQFAVIPIMLIVANALSDGGLDARTVALRPDERWLRLSFRFLVPLSLIAAVTSIARGYGGDPPQTLRAVGFLMLLVGASISMNAWLPSAFTTGRLKYCAALLMLGSGLVGAMATTWEALTRDPRPGFGLLMGEASGAAAFLVATYVLAILAANPPVEPTYIEVEAQCDGRATAQSGELTHD